MHEDGADLPRVMDISTRLQLALEMFDLGVAMQLQQLCRRHPAESPGEIQQRLAAWLGSRPGAEYGDAEGRPIPWTDLTG